MADEKNIGTQLPLDVEEELKKSFISSAMAVILGLCIMAVTFVQMRMMVKNAQE